MSDLYCVGWKDHSGKEHRRVFDNQAQAENYHENIQDEIKANKTGYKPNKVSNSTPTEAAIWMM